MGSKFGDKLRRARMDLGLTQSQLGAQKYSTSYISLLETGSREPTPEIITELSKRLGIERDVMEAWNTPVSPDEAQFVLLEHRARASMTAHDYSDACDTAAEAAELAQSMKNSSAWWNMSFLRAEGLRELGRMEDFLRAADEVLAHPLTDESEALKVRAETLVASANQGAGRLYLGVEHALKATALAEDSLPAASLFAIEARFALIACLAESGQLDEAWRACQRLDEVVSGDVPAQSAGAAHWAIGNVAFLRQDIDEGLRHHNLAAERLHPRSDIELWTRFNKASASARISAGAVEPATLACIERAEQALSVIGDLGTEGLELQVIRARWQHVNGDAAGALLALEPVQDRLGELPQQVKGEVELLTGRCQLALGELDDALKHLNAAREDFVGAGAPERAVLAVELATQLRATRR